MECTKHIAHRHRLFTGGEEWYGNWQAKATQVKGGIADCTLQTMHANGQTDIFGWMDRRSLQPNGVSGIHTTGDTNIWDLRNYDGLAISIGKSDGKIYTLSLQDEQNIAWEGTFRCDNPKGLIRDEVRVLRFANLVPERELTIYDHPLYYANIKQIRIRIHNTHPFQEGPFCLSIRSIDAVHITCSCPVTPDPVRVRREEGSRSMQLKLVGTRIKNRGLEAMYEHNLKKPRGHNKAAGASDGKEDGKSDGKGDKGDKGDNRDKSDEGDEGDSKDNGKVAS